MTSFGVSVSLAMQGRHSVSDATLAATLAVDIPADPR